MEEQWLSRRDAPPWECLRDAYSVLLLLWESRQRDYVPEKKAQKLAPAVHYMHYHYTSPLSNEALAALCNISCVYFRKLFREVYGTSPADYAKQIRTEKAKEMLRGDYGTVSEIANALGYANLYDFSREFKHRTGMSPTVYGKGKT